MVLAAAGRRDRNTGPYIIRIIRSAENRLGDEIFDFFEGSWRAKGGDARDNIDNVFVDNVLGIVFRGLAESANLR